MTDPTEFTIKTSDPALQRLILNYLCNQGQPVPLLPPADIKPALVPANLPLAQSLTSAAAPVTTETEPAKQPAILADTDLIGTSILWEDFNGKFFLPLLKALIHFNGGKKAGVAQALEKHICQKWNVPELRKLTIGQSKEVREYVPETGESRLLKLILTAHE